MINKSEPEQPSCKCAIKKIYQKLFFNSFLSQAEYYDEIEAQEKFHKENEIQDQVEFEVEKNVNTVQVEIFKKKRRKLLGS